MMTCTKKAAILTISIRQTPNFVTCIFGHLRALKRMNRVTFQLERLDIVGSLLDLNLRPLLRAARYSTPAKRDLLFSGLAFRGWRFPAG